mmetsp:Transcript_123959/g.358504  ORF Transcript_123959/g.358504 Transcript_123959/m.358504 type:complete len:84 (-) Transcript_123959:1383-1634(-)
MKNVQNLASRQSCRIDNGDLSHATGKASSNNLKKTFSQNLVEFFIVGCQYILVFVHERYLTGDGRHITSLEQSISRLYAEEML